MLDSIILNSRVDLEDFRRAKKRMKRDEKQAVKSKLEFQSIAGKLFLSFREYDTDSLDSDE